MPRGSKSTNTGVSSNNEYMTNGVSINPAVPTAGENVRVVYDGILSKHGASDVFAHVGYGTSWENIYDYRMSRTEMGFEATIPVSENNTLNLCFKDCANNWDNNSGKNYTFDITQ